MSNTFTPDVAEQLPAGGGVQTPDSGTFGEGAALDRLNAALPDGTPAQEQEVAPVPEAGGPAPDQIPTDLPPGLLAPSRNPDVPVSTPLQQPVLVGSPPENRVRILQTLVNSPEVSQDTKEWAQRVLGWYQRV